MRKKIFQFVILGLLPFLAGCIDTNDQFTINPDGSGKVVHESKLTTFYVNTQSTDSSGNVIHSSQLATTDNKQPSEDDLKGCVKGILENSKGVDAWKDISYKVEDDGRIDFKGTAYFPDISQLKIDNQGTSASMGDILFKSTTSGITLELRSQQANKPISPSTPILAKPQTEDEIKKEVAKQMQQYQQMMRPMMASFLTSLKVKESFIFPGSIETITNFQKNADGSIGIQWDGSKMLAIMDQLASDPAYITEKIKEGKNFADQNGMDASELNKKLFGQEGTVRVELVGPFKPLFDYNTEVSAAKAEYNKTLNDLKAVNFMATFNSQGPAPVNTAANTTVNNAVSPDFNNMVGSNVSMILKNGTTVEGKLIEKTKDYVKLKFKGMALTFYNDEIEKIEKVISTDSGPTSPDFNNIAGPNNEGNFKVDHMNLKTMGPSGDAGTNKYYEMYISGVLNKPVLNVVHGMVTVAQTDTDENLLMDRARDQKIHFPRTTADGLQVLFNFRLKQPSSSAAAIKEISGNLEYAIATGIENVDLGIEDFSEGAEGKQFQSVIESRKTKKDKEVLSVHLNVSFYKIKALDFYDEQGQKLQVFRWGYSKQGDSAMLEYALKNGSFPSHGKIIAEIYQGYQTYQMPFEVKNVPIVGSSSTN